MAGQATATSRQSSLSDWRRWDDGHVRPSTYASVIRVPSNKVSDHMANDRPRHPEKDLEDLLKVAEAHGWRITKRQRYYQARCPCGGCQETVHMTPSDPNYGRNKLNKMSKCPEWKG